MKSLKGILAALCARLRNQATHFKKATPEAEPEANASNFHQGQRVRLTSILYGTSEDGVLTSSMVPGKGSTYGTHTICKDEGTRYRTQGTLERPTQTKTNEGQA